MYVVFNWETDEVTKKKSSGVTVQANDIFLQLISVSFIALFFFERGNIISSKIGRV